MKRWIALSIPLLVAMIFLTAVAVVEAQRTPDWQEAVNRYVGQSNAKTPTTRQVVRVVTASLPWKFKANGGFHVIDYGRFEYTVYTYDSKEYGLRTEHVALPYPPQEMRCIFLREGDVERVLFVNYYTDNLWQYGWMIQAGAPHPESPEFLEVLGEIGCVF